LSQSVTGATADGFIESYLKGMDSVSYAGPVSLLGALMRDAEAAVSNQALWLGAVAYLMGIEQLGKTIVARTAPSRSQGSEHAFRGALEDFGPKTLSPVEVGALYGFRCALVHEYGFTNNAPGTDKHHVFAMTEHGPLVRLPAITWVQGSTGTTRRDMTTLVNVLKIQALSRLCGLTAQQMHANGQLTVVPGKSLDELISQRFMDVVLWT
jgi:hypothetical protein